MLVTMGHETLSNYHLGALGQFGLGGTHGGVYTLDLDHFHLNGGILVLIYLGHGVQDALAVSVSGTVMILYVFNMCALAYEKSVDTVVL